MNSNNIHTTTLKNIYDFANKNFYDCIKSEVEMGEGISFAQSTLSDIHNAVFQKDRKIFASLLNDGFTPMLVPTFDEDIQELRIVDEDTNECVMVFTRKELNW